MPIKQGMKFRYVNKIQNPEYGAEALSREQCKNMAEITFNCTADSELPKHCILFNNQQIRTNWCQLLKYEVVSLSNLDLHSYISSKPRCLFHPPLLKDWRKNHLPFSGDSTTSNSSNTRIGNRSTSNHFLCFSKKVQKQIFSCCVA